MKFIPFKPSYLAVPLQIFPSYYDIPPTDCITHCDDIPHGTIAFFFVLVLHICSKVFMRYLVVIIVTSNLTLHDCCYIVMDFFSTSSRRPPVTLYPPSDLRSLADRPSYNQNIVSPAPESPMSTVGPRPPSRYDSNNGSEARPQLPLEPNKKRHVESVGVSGGSSFPTSSSKRPRTLKRLKDVVQETLRFACPLYKRNPSKFGGPRGCADWCTSEIHRLYSVR
jgi:hypothetical protein